MMSPTLSFVDRYYYVTMFIANPFIYAVKFDAVRKFLIGMLPCKKNRVHPDEVALDETIPATRSSGQRRY